MSLKKIKRAIISVSDKSKLKINSEEIKNQISNWSGLENLDLASEVTTSKPYSINESSWNFEKNNFEDFL